MTKTHTLRYTLYSFSRIIGGASDTVGRLMNHQIQKSKYTDTVRYEVTVNKWWTIMLDRKCIFTLRRTVIKWQCACASFALQSPSPISAEKPPFLVCLLSGFVSELFAAFFLSFVSCLFDLFTCCRTAGSSQGSTSARLASRTFFFFNQPYLSNCKFLYLSFCSAFIILYTSFRRKLNHTISYRPSQVLTPLSFDYLSSDNLFIILLSCYIT